MSKEIYFSIDVETDGPIPGPNSLLSLGAVALDSQGNELGTFYRNFKPLEGASMDPKTREFWDRFPDMLAATQVDQRDSRDAMMEFDSWVPVAVAFPAGFDFTWIWWYSNRFLGSCVFSFSCIDMKTMAWMILKGDYRKSTKKYWPSHWFSPLPHTHHALDDAREQGQSFAAMLRDFEAGRETQEP
jgi:DNA polymerase III alpha subunit (gram-positive type)